MGFKKKGAATKVGENSKKKENDIGGESWGVDILQNEPPRGVAINKSSTLP